MPLLTVNTTQTPNANLLVVYCNDRAAPYQNSATTAISINTIMSVSDAKSKLII